MYLALYRKYRPKNFKEVIGQDHIIKTLTNQIKMDKVGHAYLFCGSRGTGKTSTAKIFAREINCTCDGVTTCSFCKDEPSLDILEIDAASNNGVDEIRDLREKVKYPPVDGKYKVYIIDEVHMLSTSAFNALLKTLEEPPKHAVFILATTEVHKLPATILSRCMRFDFKLVSVADLTALLNKVFTAEGIACDSETATLIARAGEGSVRDTLSIADRCVSFCGNELTYAKVVEVLGATQKDALASLSGVIFSGNVAASLQQLDQMLSGGKSPQVLAKDLIYFFRDLLIINTLADNAKTMVLASPEDYAKMQALATNENYNKIVQAIELLGGVEAELRYSVQPRIVLESCIIKLLTEQSLLERVEKIEKLLAGGAPIASSPAVASVAPRASSVQAANVPAQGVAPRVQATDVAPVQRPSVQSQVVQETAGKMPFSGSAEAVTSGSANNILGDLLSYIREQKLMSLLMAARQISRVAVEDKVAKLLVRDTASLQMLQSERYTPTMDEFFKARGLTWRVVDISSGSRGQAELNAKLDGRLTIK